MSSPTSTVKEIFENIALSKSEIQIIESVFRKVIVKKGTILQQPGEYAISKYYILEGCLRMYHTDKLGKEHTVQFGIKDWWVKDFSTFFNDNKSCLTIETIQDSVLYVVSIEEVNNLYKRIPKIESFFRAKLERAYGAFQKRILSYLSQSASERYITFIETYPNIEKSIKNYHIASYLGITTESLSRIRRELQKK